MLVRGAARVAGGCDMFVIMKGAAMMVGPISQVCDDWLQRALCPAAACQPRYVVTTTSHQPEYDIFGGGAPQAPSP